MWKAWFEDWRNVAAMVAGLAMVLAGALGAAWWWFIVWGLGAVLIFVALMGLERRVGGVCQHRWRIIRTIWPYEDGWGVYCPRCRTMLESGMSKLDAEWIAEAENARAKAKAYHKTGG